MRAAGSGGGPALRNKIGIGLLAAATVFLAGAIFIALWSEPKPLADPDDPAQIARGKTVYERYCASCHGAALDGQPDWKRKLPSGRMPAPPHDASGHTWHHPDAVLFGMTKEGMVPGRYAPPGYQSDMPPFATVLSDDEIWAVLAYIKSSWPDETRRAHRAIDAESRRQRP